MSRTLEKLSTAILEGDAEQAPKLVNKAIGEGATASEVLEQGLLVGMAEVGVRFRAGDMFVPEVLMSAEAMQTSMVILRPLLLASGAKLIGKVLLGTVKGDLHDI
ncbi:MAG: B12-binding domain-containing protein, partial [Chloroflexi bacterium]|nr:B12-binding domain-containing protein [Chloroflexota bacterium]